MKKLSFIGIGSATNVLLDGNCCYLKSGDNLLMIDLCEGATKKLLKLNIFERVKNIYIMITHTHYDHIAGLGVFIWYCVFNIKIKPKIIYGNYKYAQSIKKILKLTGVDEKHVEFIKDIDFSISDLKAKLIKTTHTPKLDCYGIMFKDNNGKYYYTGDTNDIDYIRKLCYDSSVIRIYTEVAIKDYGVHIKYDDIFNLDKNKLVLMHFDSIELYRKAIDDGFNVAELE